MTAKGGVQQLPVLFKIVTVATVKQVGNAVLDTVTEYVPAAKPERLAPVPAGAFDDHVNV